MTAERSGRELIFLVGITALLGSLILAPTYETVHEGYGYGLRVTARVTFAFFMLAYVARPLVRLFATGRWLVRHRRYLGLMAALSHTVHFGYVLLYFYSVDEVVDLGTKILGGLGFVLFWLMALTSNDAAVRKLGPWWKRLHLFGMHYNWLIFLVTYLASWWALPLVLAGGGLRLAAWFKARQAPV